MASKGQKETQVVAEEGSRMARLRFSVKQVGKTGDR
jgi:hypothetical protein